MTEVTKFIKQEAKENGEVVRTYPLVYGGASVEVKIYIFFKNGKITRSIKWSFMNNLFLPEDQCRLTYYDLEETMEQISFWHKMGKVPIFKDSE
ncbi:hypothetical protein KAU40_01175 [Candidatus Parcubacteria bacterium]|nr:hypothetical protein [Candidatus Parcubacteria bacterium]